MIFRIFAAFTVLFIPCWGHTELILKDKELVGEEVKVHLQNFPIVINSEFAILFEKLCIYLWGNR